MYYTCDVRAPEIAAEGLAELLVDSLELRSRHERLAHAGVARELHHAVGRAGEDVARVLWEGRRAW